MSESEALDKAIEVLKKIEGRWQLLEDKVAELERRSINIEKIAKKLEIGQDYPDPRFRQIRRK